MTLSFEKKIAGGVAGLYKVQFNLLDHGAVAKTNGGRDDDDGARRGRQYPFRPRVQSDKSWNAVYVWSFIYLNSRQFQHIHSYII